MRIATMRDVQKRLNGLKSISESKDPSAFINGAYKSIENGRIADIKRMIETAATSDYNIPFSAYIELFDAVIKNGNSSDIKKMSSIIAETTYKSKVRNNAMDFLKVLKTRMTKAHSSLKADNNKVQDAAIESLPPSPAQGVPAVNGSTVSANTDVKYDNDGMNESVVYEAYKNIYDKAVICMHCDRIIENYNRISKRFNLDYLFHENTRRNGVKDTVVSLCNKIDTYDIPTDIRFNTVIETALYGFTCNHVDFKPSDILETAVDFFLFKKDGIDSCKAVLENSVFFDKEEDMGNIGILTEEEPESEEKNIDDSIREFVNPSNYKNTSIITESTSFNDIFEKFKEEELAKDGKPENKLKALATKLYSRNVDDIVQETPSLLTWIRNFFILSTGAVPIVGPVIMVIGFIADRFIALGMEREEVSKMVTCFEREIKKSKDKLKTLETHEDKERMEKYIKSLTSAKDKIEMHYEGLLTDEEVEKRYQDLADNYEFDEDDDDFDFDLDDDFIMEAAFENLAEVVERYVSITSNNALDKYDMRDIVSSLKDDDMAIVANIAKEYPNVFHIEAFKSGIDDNIKDMRNGDIKFDSSISKACRLAALENAKSIISKEKSIKEDSNSLTVFDAFKDMNYLVEAYTAITMIRDTSDSSMLLEASITNKLNMASMKLRSLFNKMSDKDRQISQSIDLGVNNMSKSIERALTNDNRESIIKGSILPSASKIIKLGIVNAGLLAIGQPVIAAIVTLGYLGTSARFKAKERQMLVDEIEIELKMCDKYIEIAEQKNDMKALKQLLMIKRDLERQHQRIKYKMKVELGQKYYDTKTTTPQQ